jgi:hypothetical protein
MAYSGQLGWLYWDINSIVGRAIESAQPDGQAGHQVVLRVYLAAKPVIKEYTTMATMVASEKYKPKVSLPTGGLVIELLNDRSRSWSGGTRAAGGFCHPHGPMLSLAKRFCARQRPNSILAVCARYAVSPVILTCNRLSAAAVFIVLMAHYVGYIFSFFAVQTNASVRHHELMIQLGALADTHCPSHNSGLIGSSSSALSRYHHHTCFKSLIIGSFGAQLGQQKVIHPEEFCCYLIGQTGDWLNSGPCTG